MWRRSSLSGGGRAFRRWVEARWERSQTAPPDTFEILESGPALRREASRLAPSADDELAAICLSGGGIRSAAFCLGAIRPLLRDGLLDQFHYLSTVSGGGFTGSWLTRWIADHAMPPDTLLDDPATLQALRRYTNYLTPVPGLASLDTWAGILLWIRNTLINWAILLPVLLGLAAAMMLYLLLLGTLETGVFGIWLSRAAGVAGLCGLCVSIRQAIILLPSHEQPDVADPTRPAGPDAATVMRAIVWPGLAWAFLAPIAVFPLLAAGHGVEPVWRLFWIADPHTAGLCASQIPPELVPDLLVRADPPCRPWQWPIWILPFGSLLAGLLAYLLGWIHVARSYHDGQPKRRRWPLYWVRHDEAFRRNRLAWLCSCACSAFMLGVGVILAQDVAAVWIAVAGPPWVMGSDVLRSTVYVALRREGLRTALDREWLARLNADKLRLVLGYDVLAAATLLLPPLILDGRAQLWKTIVAVAGFLSGPTAAWIGSSAKAAFQPGDSTETKRPLLLRSTVWLPLAALLFITSLLMLFGRLAALLTFRIAEDVWGSAPDIGEAFVAALLLLLACLAASLSMGRIVKINRFSLHAVYANRLIRAFLGSARRLHTRAPDPFTDFDPADNTRVADMFEDRERGRPARLFPVINATLNVTQTTDTARAERKAVPFTITPLHCGSRFLRGGTGAYVPTACYAGGEGRETGPEDKSRGLSLGTAMTLSGAAVSPNMGYHSSALTAFVMTLFNVRLGAWMPNPGMSLPTRQPWISRFATWINSGSLKRVAGIATGIPPDLDGPRQRQHWMQQASPHDALWPMLQELLGTTRMDSRYVYLSDGGHFDNLGLYEMLHRRCRRILVIDAGQDGKYVYTDLGRTLQHALLDLGVTVDFISPIRTGEPTLHNHGAFAEITYPARDGRDPASGQLVYIKPWLPPEAPAELHAFAALKQSFPHASTADQFFTESDFESYRRLGDYLVDQILKGVLPDAGGTLEELFDRLRVLAR
ncbi:hypothetical protein [Lichenicola sp.]|uniref:hypothetical protein n=1 Tax=Lichenicola sp. TaxID=2804529 RepID=UPI003B00A7D3